MSENNRVILVADVIFNRPHLPLYDETYCQHGELFTITRDIAHARWPSESLDKADATRRDATYFDRPSAIGHRPFVKFSNISPAVYVRFDTNTNFKPLYSPFIRNENLNRQRPRLHCWHTNFCDSVGGDEAAASGDDEKTNNRAPHPLLSSSAPSNSAKLTFLAKGPHDDKLSPPPPPFFSFNFYLHSAILHSLAELSPPESARRDGHSHKSGTRPEQGAFFVASRIFRFYGDPNNITAFSDYILKNYIEVGCSFPPDLWADIPSEELRTTNGPENYHKHLKALFYHSKP
ncbi:hypothetical protein V9T40_008029 [Parthenolecanium corni]|uniref:Uncharacterized protein n=1 Tax=Parthenolecanium corni TaxID=536013 RepID=A0AAN9TTD3_9HEMI